MSAPAQLIRHGTLTTPVLVADRVRRSSRGLDEGVQVYHCDRPDVFFPGNQHPLYPGLRINEVDEVKLPGIVETTLHCSGLKTGTSRRVSLDWEENPFSWDIATEEWIVRDNTASLSWGTALTGFSNMRYMGGGESYQLDGRYIVRTYQYKGIRRTGLAHRRATVNDNVVSPSEPITVNLPGGDGLNAHNYNVSLPRVVVVETVKTTSAPNMASIPGTVSTPISGVSFPSVSTIPATITGSDLTYNWPQGWKIANIEPDQLAATIGLYVTTYTYEFVWEFQW